MRKRISGRRFKKDTNQRKTLFKSLMRAFVLNGSIKTTEAKAKAIRPDVEKLLTKAIKHGENARVHLQKHVDEETVVKLIAIAPQFKDRPGGYTRIMRLGSRVKDNASMVLMEWVEVVAVTPVVKEEKAAKKPKVKTVKKEATVSVKEKKTTAKTKKTVKKTK